MELLVKKVSAPLNITQMSNIDSNVIYEFNYETSSFDINKPNEFINYMENVGYNLDIYIPASTPFSDKEKLLLLYFNTERNFKVLSMIEAMTKILFMYKNIDTKKKFKSSFLTDQECLEFIANNKEFVEKHIIFFDSLFVVMLLLAKHSDFDDIKKYFSLNQITEQHITSNMCSILLLPDFYDYYKNGINKDKIMFYDYTFNNIKVDNKTFLNLLYNENNYIIRILGDLNDKRFQKYLKDNNLLE